MNNDNSSYQDVTVNDIIAHKLLKTVKNTKTDEEHVLVLSLQDMHQRITLDIKTDIKTETETDRGPVIINMCPIEDEDV